MARKVQPGNQSVTAMERIVAARTALNVAQGPLAEMLDIGRGSLSDVENGKIEVTDGYAERCVRLCREIADSRDRDGGEDG